MTKRRIHVLSLAPMTEAQKQRLEKCGVLVYADAVLHDPQEAEKCRGADILIVTPRLHQNVVAVLDHCQLISVQAVGTDCLDLAAATGKGILVTNVANASLTRVAVAEHALALLLALARRLPGGARLLRDRLWKTGIAYQPTGLSGKTLGIVGWGGIGQNIARIARGFGLRLLMWTAHPEKYRQTHPEARFVPLGELLAQSDFVILAAPATPQTQGMISAATLPEMKPTALLVNVGRGSLVVEEDLAAAVRNGVIAGAATDVFVQEPPPPDHPLLSLPDVVATPHIAGGTPEAIAALLDQSISNVEAYLAGRPINVVNPEALRHESGS
ncbi:MAG: 2-hydroxyacid dehydrogenase [Acidobacteria bacterium]|nr:2-hydroxyacid dehydrogenase [Acidobacteriota bacterium]